jgi:hypothetical protein
MGLGFYRGRDSKYNAQPDRCREGILHHSKMEARRCTELHLLARANPPVITELRAHPQPVYDLVVNGRKVTRYVADFEYVDENGDLVTEDTKGYRTAEYRIKAELFAALYGREVTEVRRVRGR